MSETMTQETTIEQTTNTTALLQCNVLSKYYGKHKALSDITLTLESGQIVGLLGPNGSGKTTFIKILNGLLTPTSGEILINGLKPSAATKAMVSYLPDRNFIDVKMTAEKIIDLFSSFYKDFDSNRAYKMLVDLNIDPFVPLKTFSKGTKEKVQLILVMSRNAQLYVLDEPIGGVDPAARDYIINTILNNYNPDSTVIISTHLISEVENILDRVIFIKEGSILVNATVDGIRTDKGCSVNDLFREVFKCY